MTSPAREPDGVARLQVDVDPSDAAMKGAERTAPDNPFCTPAYARARSALGELPWLFSMENDSSAPTSFYGFSRPVALGRHLEIPSIPSGIGAEGLTKLCRANGVRQLELNSYASPAGRLPAFPSETARCARTEFIIDLQNDELLPSISRDHRQRIKRAQRAGLVLRRTVEESAAVAHAQLIATSMSRRESRGEEVSTTFPVAPILALLRAGAGELFQAVDGARVLSSMLLLRSRLTAYDHTSGSSAEGMSVGASRLLIFLACNELRNERCVSLNLGGVRPHEAGLRAFKEHFGARPVELEAVSVELTTPLLRLARGAARVVRRALRTTARVGGDR